MICLLQNSIESKLGNMPDRHVALFSAVISIVVRNEIYAKTLAASCQWHTRFFMSPISN
jgi:hypothetical protein